MSSCYFYLMHSIQPQKIQEQLSRAYIQALVTNSGQIINFHNDMDFGTDCTISAAYAGKEISNISILDVQLKATTNYRENDTHYIYDMEMKAVRFLTNKKASVKRIVLVLLQPKERTNWIEHCEVNRFLAIKNLVYWVDSNAISEKGLNNQTQLAVYIPKEQVFNEKALYTFIKTITQENTQMEEVKDEF